MRLRRVTYCTTYILVLCRFYDVVEPIGVADMANDSRRKITIAKRPDIVLERLDPFPGLSIIMRSCAQSLVLPTR